MPRQVITTLKLSSSCQMSHEPAYVMAPRRGFASGIATYETVDVLPFRSNTAVGERWI
jgi:hypothetical protein